jgi:predicted RNase H-like HicB family nuclease
MGAEVMQKQLTAIIEREADGYVSLCPELDIASQGATIEEAGDNLREALELFLNPRHLMRSVSDSMRKCL